LRGFIVFVGTNVVVLAGTEVVVVVTKGNFQRIERENENCAE
jgi:hypothetical protein